MSSPSQRGLLAGIENEALVPLNTIALHSDFSSDLSQLSSLLSPTSARYVLLKIAPGESDGFVAVTYVPNAAPVREKMLFASTRLTLVRELGIERFRETLFATEAAELTAEGWAKHEKHSTQAAPLTQEEEGQAGLREAEAQESGGTTARKGHVASKLDAVTTEDGLEEKLGELMKEGSGGLLVQLASTHRVSVSPAAPGNTYTDIIFAVLQPARRDPPRRLLHALRCSCPAGQHLVADRPAPQLLLVPWKHNTNRVHLHLPFRFQAERTHDVQHEQEVHSDDRRAEGRRCGQQEPRGNGV